MFLRHFGFFCLPVLLTAQTNVLTGQYDNARTSANAAETRLLPATVSSGHFGKLFARAVDGYVYAQPLYVSNVPIPGKGLHNVVYAATMHDSLYAFDADDPNASAPSWKTSLGTPVPHNPSQSLTLNTSNACTDSASNPVTAPVTGGSTLTPEIGVLSTPLIDNTARTIYAVSANLENKTTATSCTLST